MFDFWHSSVQDSPSAAKMPPFFSGRKALQ